MVISDVLNPMEGLYSLAYFFPQRIYDEKREVVVIIEDTVQSRTIASPRRGSSNQRIAPPAGVVSTNDNQKE